MRHFFGILALAFGLVGLLPPGVAGGNDGAGARDGRFRIPSSQLVHVTHYSDPQQFRFLDGRHDAPAGASDRLRYYMSIARENLRRCETRGDIDALQLVHRTAVAAESGRATPLPLRKSDAVVYPLCGYHTAPLTRLSIGIDAAPFSRVRLPRDHRFYYFEERMRPWEEEGNMFLGEGYPVDWLTKDILSNLRRNVGSGFSIKEITVFETMDLLDARDERKQEVARHGIVRYDAGDGGPLREHVHLNIRLSQGDPAQVQPWIEAYRQEIVRHRPRLWLFRATQNRFLEADGYNPYAHSAHAAWIEATVRDSSAGGFIAEGREHGGDGNWRDPALWDDAGWEFFGSRPLPVGSSTVEFRGVEWGYATEAGVVQDHRQEAPSPPVPGVLRVVPWHCTTAAGTIVPQLRIVSVPGAGGF